MLHSSPSTDRTLTALCPRQSKRDLGFIEGDLIECLNAGDGSWWVGRLYRDRRTVGSFPSNFVEVLPDEFRPTTRSVSPLPAPATPSPKGLPAKSKTFRKPFEAYAKAPHYTSAKQPETFKDPQLSAKPPAAASPSRSLHAATPRLPSPSQPRAYASRAPSPSPAPDTVRLPSPRAPAERPGSPPPPAPPPHRHVGPARSHAAQQSSHPDLSRNGSRLQQSSHPDLSRRGSHLQQGSHHAVSRHGSHLQQSSHPELSRHGSHLQQGSHADLSRHGSHMQHSSHANGHADLVPHASHMQQSSHPDLSRHGSHMQQSSHPDLSRHGSTASYIPYRPGSELSFHDPHNLEPLPWINSLASDVRALRERREPCDDLLSESRRVGNTYREVRPSSAAHGIPVLAVL